MLKSVIYAPRSLPTVCIVSANSQAKSGRKADKRYLTDNMLYVLWYLSHGLLQIPTVCIGDQSDWDPKGVIFIMSRWRSWLPQPTISLGFLCHSVLEWIWIKSHINPRWRLPQNKRVHNQHELKSFFPLYPNFIQILSTFFWNSLYPDFILILSWFYPDFIWIKYGWN